MDTAPEQLSRAVIPPEVLEVLETLERAGFKAYLVGGSIRDLLRGAPAKDYDVATSARAERVVQLFRRVVPTGIKHGTVTVLARQRGVEVTTFRGEGAYADGRRPDSVTFLEDIVEDLARRDFTINAMAFNPARREFVDPFGGLQDLRAGLLRCVGNPRQRFSEDGLRCLRAVRFASVLNLSIERDTLAAIPLELDTFSKVAVERVREELCKLLVGAHPGFGVRLLGSTGLLSRILPELVEEVSSKEAERHLEARIEALAPELELRLAGLLWELAPSLALPAAERLRFPRKTQELLASLWRHRGFTDAHVPDQASLRRAIAACGRTAVGPLLDLAAAQAKAEGGGDRLERIEALRTRVRAALAANPPLSVGELALDGRQIMEALGEKPGPRVGQAARFLLDQVLEDPSLNSREAMNALLRGWRARG
jgi:tRNA nucleotidyltransferase (CCA-adding enzyme)